MKVGRPKGSGWKAEEISTRNCFNAVTDGQEVLCRVGRGMGKKNGMER